MRLSSFLVSNIINRSMKEIDKGVKIGRPSLIHTNPRIVDAMQKARFIHGMTLHNIAILFNVSIPTVAKYTKFIPNARRPNTFRKFNVRTGEVV
jgi:hypothetical protein